MIKWEALEHSQKCVLVRKLLKIPRFLQSFFIDDRLNFSAMSALSGQHMLYLVFLLLLVASFQKKKTPWLWSHFQKNIKLLIHCSIIDWYIVLHGASLDSAFKSLKESWKSIHLKFNTIQIIARKKRREKKFDDVLIFY